MATSQTCSNIMDKFGNIKDKFGNVTSQTETDTLTYKIKTLDTKT